MITFDTPEALWLALPLAALWWLFARGQRQALAWITSHVAARFRTRLTAHDRRSLERHLGLLLGLGLLLVIAVARPTVPGRERVDDGGSRVLLLIDASASMYATDVEPIGLGEEVPLNRLDIARRIGARLAARLEDSSFALASFAGTAAIHLPMIRDRALVTNALAAVETHGYYRNTGSSFVRALDIVPRFVDRRGPLQVVMLSDGEQPFAEDYTEALQPLVEQRIPVHTVAVGSLTGQARRILDFRDLAAGKEDPATLVRFTTRRVDEHLERIASRTGGRFEVAAPGVAERLAAAVGETRGGGAATDDEWRRDLSPAILTVFLGGLLAHLLLVGRRPDIAPAFDLERLARAPPPGPRAAAALTILLLLGLESCGGSPRRQAHRQNELGIAADRVAAHAAAATRYRRSRAFEVEPWIPVHNLARSRTLDADFAEAHRLFQEALQLRPELTRAHYNDGIALYRWGVAERDPQDCRLERTLDLWTRAQQRFEAVVERDAAGDLGARARANLRFLAGELDGLIALIAAPPEHCRSQEEEEEPPPGEGGGGEKEPKEQDEDNGGDAADDDEESPSGGGGGEQEPDGAGSGPTAPPTLSGADLDRIRKELERISGQALAEGTFHRRTRAEQHLRQDWANPEARIWW